MRSVAVRLYRVTFGEGWIQHLCDREGIGSWFKWEFHSFRAVLVYSPSDIFQKHTLHVSSCALNHLHTNIFLSLFSKPVLKIMPQTF